MSKWIDENDGVERIHPQQMDGFLDDSIDWFSTQYNHVTDWAASQWDAASGAVSDQWTAAVNRWHEAVAELEQNMQRHQSMRHMAEQLGPEELEAWEAQKEKVEVIQGAITTLRNQLAAVTNWASSTFGSNNLQGMGAIPLVPIAVITGSIAAVVAVSYSVFSYDNQLQAKWDYIKANPDMTPDQVADLISSGGGGMFDGTFSGASNAAMWIAIAGALFVFGPRVMKMLENNRR